MSLATATGLASFDQSAGEFLDLSNELAEIIRRDNTSFISRVGMSGAASQTLHSWMEDQLNPNFATMAETGGLDGSKTDIDVAAGQGKRFMPGTLFRVSRPGANEVIQVTAVSTDNLTIVRGYGSTSPENHGSTTNWQLQIIGNPKQEGVDMPDDESVIRSKVGNYTQIFQKGVKTTHTMRSVLQAGVADEFSFQIARRMLEIMRELDSSVVAGISSGSQGSDAVYRSMGGVWEFATQAGGNVTTTSEALSPAVINAMCKQIWDDGGQPNFILVGGKQKRAISGFDQAYRRMNYDSNVAGYLVDRFLSDLGFVLDVIVDPWMADDQVIIGDLSKVKIMPLQGDAMRAEELAKTGRAWNAQVTGQYTCEVRNAKEAFAAHNNLI